MRKATVLCQLVPPNEDKELRRLRRPSQGTDEERPGRFGVPPTAKSHLVKRANGPQMSKFAAEPGVEIQSHQHKPRSREGRTSLKRHGGCTDQRRQTRIPASRARRASDVDGHQILEGSVSSARGGKPRRWGKNRLRLASGGCDRGVGHTARHNSSRCSY